MMDSASDVFSTVLAVVINYQTPDLTRRAVESFRRYYPAIPVLIIDNGSGGNSISILQNLQRQAPHLIELKVNHHNLHHGPAMDQALRRLSSTFLLFLDSDCEVRLGGFVERMLQVVNEQSRGYVVGKQVRMNARGFEVSESEGSGFPYIRPFCMLVKRELYLTLPHFRRHGTPCLANQAEANARGLALIDFPVEDYVSHKGRGTAERYGYQLGFRGKLNHFLNKLGL